MYVILLAKGHRAAIKQVIRKLESYHMCKLSGYDYQWLFSSLILHALFSTDAFAFYVDQDFVLLMEEIT
jgi:hypothetical protein